jgi:carotenoid cleavage dioxygenase-like enzyme
MTYDRSLTKMIEKNFHVLECLKYLEDEYTDVFFVNLKTGDVQEIQVDAYFFQHHINAYEINDGREVIVDLSPSDPWGLAEYVKMENMMNPPEFSNGSNADGVGEAEITRYHFHLDTGSVETISFPNLMEKDNALSRYINKFDFPTINEAYRGKEYCIIYGWSAYDYSRTAMVKKNTCDATKDKVIYMENHYTSEMSFIPDPEGTKEDDGVLETIVFDGEKEQSYLLLIDASSFEIIDKAYLPHNIPWSAHGMHFPEAKWTLS